MPNHDDPRILPFLWVHGESEAVYRDMVRAIYDANLRAFCVEARPHQGFCREPWWRDMAILLDEAEKRGMRVWILDDKHFPTGYAAGAAEKAPLALRRQGLLHKRFPVKGGRIRLDAARQAHPPRVPRDAMYLVTNIYNKNTTPANTFTDDALLSVAALRLDEKAAPIDLTDRLQNGVLDWTAPAGKWEVQLCYLSRNIGTHRSYINMMDAASCRLQIDAVYEPHYQHFADKFGTVIAGFFSDEPELGNNRMYKMDNPLGTEQDLPWSRELAAALEEKLGAGYGALMQYADRVTGMLSGGHAVCPVAVLYHGEAEWCGKAMLMQKPGRILQDNQIDFHYVPADVFGERDFYRTEITDQLTVNGLNHEALVIPHAQFITRETAEAVIELAAKGGKVLFLDGYPDGLCTGEALPESVKENTRVVALSALLGELAAYRTVTLAPADDRIRAMHYVGGKEFFYLFNEGDKPWHGTVTLPEEGSFHIYDAWHDRHMAWDGGDLTIEPHHSLFLVKGEAESLYTPPALGRRRALEGFRLSVCKAADYPRFGPAREIGKPENYALTDKKFSGFICYETHFTGKAQLLEITDAWEGVEVFVNGRSAGIQVTPPYRYDLRSLAGEGDNALTIEVATTLERDRGNTKTAAPTGITGEVALYE